MNKESDVECVESDDGSSSSTISTTTSHNAAPIKVENKGRVTKSKKKTIQSQPPAVVKKEKSIENKKTNSMESIYEDALQTVPQSRKQSNELNLYNSIVVLEKLVSNLKNANDSQDNRIFMLFL